MPETPPAVFISYRRQDTLWQAAFLYERLSLAFGKPHVFFDIDSVPIASNVQNVIRDYISRSDVLLVIIGKEWQPQRLAQVNDYVRMELEEALSSPVTLLPALIDTATMPEPESLPDEFRELAFLNAARLRPHPDFNADLNRLIEAIIRLSDLQKSAPDNASGSSVGELLLAGEAEPKYASKVSASTSSQRLEFQTPLLGLRAFDEQDSDIFFGREDLVDRAIGELVGLRNRTDLRGILIRGSSGSGKSSILRAGIVPRLRRAENPWLLVGPLRPLNEPISSLATALGVAFAGYGRPRSINEIEARLQSDPSALSEFCTELLAASERPESTVLIVVDQLEELTAQNEASDANKLIELLRVASSSMEKRVLFAGAIRTDFLAAFDDICGRDLRLIDMPIYPMSRDQLREVITASVALIGRSIDSVLVDKILADLGEPPPLPLLGFVLLELAKTSVVSKHITDADYERIGGVALSLTVMVDQLFFSLSANEQEIARKVFLSMVKIVNGIPVRQPMRLYSADEAIRSLVERFVEAGVITTYSDDKGQWAEVSHESLFNSWPRMSAWIKEQASSLQLQSELARAAREWQSTGYSSSHLWSDSRAEAAAQQLSFYDGLDFEGRNFLMASLRRSRLRRRMNSNFMFLVIVIIAILVLCIMQLIRQVSYYRARLGEIEIAASAPYGSTQEDAGC